MLNAIDEKIVEYAKNPKEGPNIVAIGGGTGLSTLLRGIKLFSDHITAIVTVADNGGSSGMLREDLGILPPGDIRNCILALADTEPLMNDLFNHRFSEGRLSGQNFGNLFIAAMSAVSDNFYDAVRNVSKVLAVKGQVLPVSLQSIQIGARYRDGSIVYGESEIGHHEHATDNPIEEVFMQPAGAKALPEAVQRLKQADLIILGPGSLYTSIIPNLLFPEITAAIEKSDAVTVYVNNIMTQPAETRHYDAGMHLEALLRHADKMTAPRFIDYCVVNDGWIEADLIERYKLQSAIPVEWDFQAMNPYPVQVVSAPLVCINNGMIRHDHTSLAKILLRLAAKHLKA